MNDLPLLVTLHCRRIDCERYGLVCRLHRVDIPTDLLTGTLGRTFYEGHCGRGFAKPECPDGNPLETIPL